MADVAGTSFVHYVLDRGLGFEEAALAFARGLDWLHGLAPTNLAAPLPAMLAPWSYHAAEAAQLEADLARLDALCAVERANEGMARQQRRGERDRALLVELRREEDHLRALLAAFERWRPGEAHECVRRAASSQLGEALLSAVCARQGCEQRLANLAAEPPLAAFERHRALVAEDLAAWREAAAKQEARVASANEWLVGLRESLASFEEKEQ